MYKPYIIYKLGIFDSVDWMSYMCVFSPDDDQQQVIVTNNIVLLAGR